MMNQCTVRKTAQSYKENFCGVFENELQSDKKIEPSHESGSPCSQQESNRVGFLNSNDTDLRNLC